MSPGRAASAAIRPPAPRRGLRARRPPSRDRGCAGLRAWRGGGAPGGAEPWAAGEPRAGVAESPAGAAGPRAGPPPDPERSGPRRNAACSSLTARCRRYSVCCVLRVGLAALGRALSVEPVRHGSVEEGMWCYRRGRAGTAVNRCYSAVTGQLVESARPRAIVDCVWVVQRPDISLVQGAGCSRSLAGEGNREPFFCAWERMPRIRGHQTERSRVLPLLFLISRSGLREQETWLGLSQGCGWETNNMEKPKLVL